MSLGHFEKETVTHKNENTLQVYRHKFVHFLFNAKTLSSNTFQMGEISNVTSPNSGSNYILKLLNYWAHVSSFFKNSLILSFMNMNQLRIINNSIDLFIAKFYPLNNEKR